MSKLRIFASLLLLLALWTALANSLDTALLPKPWATLQTLGTLLAQPEVWKDILLTLFRGSLGCALALCTGYALGMLGGLCSPLHDFLAPVVVIMQSCPAIIWISLLLVWASIGGTVPVAVVFVSVFPVVFINLERGTRALPREFLEMARLYRVPPLRILVRLLLPALRVPFLSALRYGAGVAWKVAATAEFLGAQDGIGARIQLAYQNLKIEELFAFAILIVIFELCLLSFKGNGKR